MKILFCDNRLGGLLGFRIDIIRHLHQQGHEIVLVVPPPSSDWDKVGIQIEGVKIVYVAMNPNGHNPIADIKLFNQYIRIFKQEHPNLIFTYTIKPNIYANISARLLHIRTISMVAGLGYAFEGSSLLKRMIRRMCQLGLRAAEKILVLNQNNYDILLEHRFATKDQLVLLQGGEGVNLACYPYAPSSYADGVTFLMVSRILYNKGYREFVGAARYVLKRNSNVRFELLGPTAYDSPMGVPHQVLEADRSSGAFNYLGVSNHVAQLLSRPNVVLVLPSYYPEGLNRSLMEACAVGRPIITTNIPGCQETVDEDKNGYLVPIKDVHALAAAMERFIQLDEDKKQTMAQHSYMLAKERFDVQEVIQLYETLI
ncbi:MAG: glycosyltransferase family 4 protein [Bacteroidales bacterium]|nr:glycosyltransferase family 4 protein [Candidatus Colicola caccequi]